MSYFRILPADNQIVWRWQDYHSAHPTGRKRVDRCRFCDEVAHATTYIGAEVEALLRLAVEMVKRQVENGDILEFGDICTLTSSFQSRIVEKGKTEFTPNIHINRLVVRLFPSKKYLFSMR